MGSCHVSLFYHVHRLFQLLETLDRVSRIKGNSDADASNSDDSSMMLASLACGGVELEPVAMRHRSNVRSHCRASASAPCLQACSTSCEMPSGPILHPYSGHASTHVFEQPGRDDCVPPGSWMMGLPSGIAHTGCYFSASTISLAEILLVGHQSFHARVRPVSAE